MIVDKNWRLNYNIFYSRRGILLLYRRSILRNNIKIFDINSFYVIIIISLLFNACQSAGNKEMNNLDSWIGKYTFDEYFPPNQYISYEIVIYKENFDYFAELSADGFQTLTRIKAKIEGDKETIDLIFFMYLPDNIIEQYSPGDILLSLKNVNQEILTFWGKFTSNTYYLDGETGKVYFRKE